MTTGMTIPQYTRQLRLERAVEVGYSSMSHFSQAFHETFGCYPGLYPLRTPVQKRKDEFP